jgi:hypothetical protein
MKVPTNYEFLYARNYKHGELVKALRLFFNTFKVCMLRVLELELQKGFGSFSLDCNRRHTNSLASFLCGIAFRFWDFF